MKTSCTLQIHIDGAWRDAGALSLIGPAERGMAAPVFLAYDTAHVVDYQGRRDAAAWSANFRLSTATRSRAGRLS